MNTDPKPEDPETEDPKPEFDSDEYWYGDGSMPEVTYENYMKIFDEPDAPDYGRLKGLNIRFPGA